VNSFFRAVLKFSYRIGSRFFLVSFKVWFKVFLKKF
jgi:hypothetical protein